MLRDGYNVQFEGTIVQTSPAPTLLRENHIQRDQGWSWIVLFAAFLTLFVTNGMHASFGILYAELISHFDSGREETAWIGSISLGLLCFFCPVASVLIEQIGCRATSIIGAFLCSLGFLLSSFATGIALLYFSHGLLFGLGTSLTYSAAMTVVTRSFERRRNIATGLCASGSQFGGISLAPLSQVLFDRLGYANTFRTFAGLLLVVAIASLVYRSEQDNTSRPTSAKKSPREMLNVWKSKPYIVWALGTTMVTLGYNIPRYTLAKYAIDQGISKDASAWLVSYLCASSAIGRITFGRLCEWIPNMYLCQACIIGCAISAFLYPFLKSYLALVITAIIFGLPDGGFVASLSVVTMEIVGPEKMVEGFGFMLFCQSYSNVIGPPLSGMLYDTYKSYKAAFCFAAVPEIIGALLLFLVPYYRRSQVKYTHEIECGSNSRILATGEASAINPISEDPILATEADPQGEYNVVINLTSDSPDLRLVNVIIHKPGRTETIPVARNDSEGGDDRDAQIQDSGITNRATGEVQMPVCSGESSNIACEDLNPVDKSATESRGTTVIISSELESNTMSSPTCPVKSSSSQTVIYDGETHYVNSSTQTENGECTHPSVLTSTISSTDTSCENDKPIIDICEAQEAVQGVPTTQLVALVTDSQSDGGQNFEAQNIINLELQLKMSDKSLLSEASASCNRVTSNAVDHSKVHEDEDIVHLEAEQDVPKISPPPQHKHHVNTMKADHVPKVDASLPEVMLAELDTLVQGSDITTPRLAATPFTADVNNNQQQSLIKCSGLESGMTVLESGLEPTGLDPGLAGMESGLGHNQESLMLSTTFIPEMTSSCVSTAFSTEPSHMSGINDVLTQKQLPEPLKPTSLGSVVGNEHQTCNPQDVPPVTSPLSCELSTVIADVIQSLTSQQSSLQKSNKESTISFNVAENTDQKNTESNDQPVKKNNTVEMAVTKEPMLGLNVEPSSQASSALSSYYKLQTSVLHSMQSIVAEGCPEDVALLEDISIDLTLDKDPSFASIVLIDDVDEQNNIKNISSSSHGLVITQPCGISQQEQRSFEDEPAIKYPSVISNHGHQHFSGLTHAQTIITSSAVSCKMSLEPTSTLPSMIPANESNINVRTSMIPNQEHSLIGQRDESANITPSINPIAIGPTVQQFPDLRSGQAYNPTNTFPSMILQEEVHVPATGLRHGPANTTIITSSNLSRPLSHEPTRTNQQPATVDEETTSQTLPITTQGVTFQSVIQELTPPCTTSPSSAQANYIPKLNLTCNLQHDATIIVPALGQNSNLPHESTTVNHSDATVLQDTIGLCLFPHSAGYDDGKPREQIAKQIESTNPFYQDINR